jgi:acyl-coenzyme A thioesterase PaaI-like protein
MRDLNPKHVEGVIDLINQGPFFRLLSLEVKDLGQGYSLVEMEVGHQHMNPFGGLHGGA